MLYTLRLIITVIYRVPIYTLGCIYCLFSPRNPKHVATFGHMFGCLALLYGLKVECRMPVDAQNYGSATCICNHQNNYDMVTAANIIQPLTVATGKESLLWALSFGQLYWLASSLLVGRNNRARAHDTIAAMANHFKKRRISVWMFPKEARNRGHGLLPLKTGASHTVVVAGAPVIPVCVSTASNRTKLNRLNNGLTTAEMLSPVGVSCFGEDQVHELAAHCRTLMERKIAELDKEVAERETASKV